MSNSYKILHLYPDLLNLYGDKGNIMSLKKRLEWRGYTVEVTEHTADAGKIDLNDTDIVFLGGGADREEESVLKMLLESKDEIRAYVENGGVMLAACGYPMLGKTIVVDGTKIEGLGILDVVTVDKEDRLISDVVLESEIIDTKIVGFENHSKRTDIKNHTPLGKVINGYGNDKNSLHEGVIYKNVVATYLHGPLLPKNPKLCDYILLKAIQRRNPQFTDFQMLDDTLEMSANEYMVNRFKK